MKTDSYSKLSTQNILLFDRLMELKNLYSSICLLNDKTIMKTLSSISLSKTNRFIVKQLIYGCIISLCKIYEFPRKDGTNVNIHSYLKLTKENISEASRLMEIGETSLRKKIVADQSKINEWQNYINTLFDKRNKLIAHSDFTFYFSRVEEDDFDYAEKQLEKNTEKMSLIFDKLYEFIDLTINLLEYYVIRNTTIDFEKEFVEVTSKHDVKKEISDFYKSYLKGK